MRKVSAREIASLCLHDPKHFEVQLTQTKHRIALVSNWNIPEGAKVLELGCGQGDCTAVLAELVGPTGHVTAVDPAPLTYGHPYTVKQTREYLSAGRLGPQITWEIADPLEFLRNNKDQYDFIVLVHCVWYFASPAVIEETFGVLATRGRSICIAEWSLSSANAELHILAVLASALLASHKPATEANIRTIISPTRIKCIAKASGLRVQSERNVVPKPDVMDGQWEVRNVLMSGWSSEVDENFKDDRKKSVVLAMKDATMAILQRKGGLKYVRPMDVWCVMLSAYPEPERPRISGCKDISIFSNICAWSRASMLSL